MEVLAVLVVTGFKVGVGVVIDDLDRPLGILELHLLLLVPGGNLLLAFPLMGRHAITAWLLLLLLVELLCELLDLPSLLGAMAPRVVHRTPRITLVSAGGLPQLLVTSWAMAPTSHYSSSGGSGSPCQRHIVIVAASLLLLPIFVFVAALSSGICFRHAGLPYLQSKLEMPCMPFCNLGALVCQAEELIDVLHVVCG
jgi:hypothetical protein